MKRLCAVWVLLTCLASRGQRSISSYSLSVTFKKTTNVIFPYRIEKADIGSNDVIGHKDQALGNVLFLKAARKDFTPTNLSVYTSDGKFYSFIICYKQDPDTLNLSFIADPKIENKTIDTFLEDQLDSDAVNILSQPPFLHRKKKSQDIKIILNGIYLMNDMIWMRMIIKNHSQIPYKPTIIQFSIRDKKVGKRTAVQESELPFTWSNAAKMVPGKGKGIYVFAFRTFTIPSQKKLFIHVEEKNGSRELNLSVKNKLILDAKSLDD